MASDGRVVFEITGDNSGIKKSLSETTQDIQTETAKWDSSVSDTGGNISNSLIGAFKAVTASAAFIQMANMLTKLGMESIDLASDLEEVQNVVDVTFGSGADKVGEWAKNAAKQFGLTELQAKKYASFLGAMFKSGGLDDSQVLEMSTSLAGLAADMASFYNLDFDQAFEKIQSAMAGMSQPMRQLGIDMTDTAMAAFVMEHDYAKAWGKMSEQEKTMVRYAALMEKTAGAQGDFARTSDSFANSQRRMQTSFDTLKTQLGEALLPIATTLTNAINDMLDVLTYVPPETALDKASDSIADANGQAAQAQGILGYMAKLQEKYGDMAESTEEWKEALTELKGVMPEVTQFIDSETGALTATNEQLREYVENVRKAAVEDAKRNAVKEINEQYVQAGKDYYTAEIKRELAEEQANEAIKNLIDIIVRGYEAQGLTPEHDTEGKLDRERWFSEYQEGLVAFDFLVSKAESMARYTGDDEKTISTYEKIYNEQTKAADNYTNSMNSLRSTMDLLQTEAEIAAAAVARMEAAANNAAGALNTVPSMTSGEYYNWYYGSHSHAGGLNYVPYDNYFAILHKGERVQTAAEASLQRQYSAMQPGLNYATLGSAMWANAPAMGGNVYLEGRTVGRVISDMQGRSYRNLERSGWQQ